MKNIIIIIILFIFIIGGVFAWQYFEAPKETEKVCVDNCGNGICEEIVCMAIGCPCPETKETCPQDCK